MSRIPLSFRAVALLLTLTILPWSAAAEPLHRVSKTTPIWSWLIHLWEKNGCAIDPWGHCQSGATPVQPKNGCGIDPHGQCQPGVAPAQPDSTENGCSIDPGGRCLG